MELLKDFPCTLKQNSECFILNTRERSKVPLISDFTLNQCGLDPGWMNLSSETGSGFNSFPPTAALKNNS